MARLLADEDVAFPVVERLRELGHDIVTMLELGEANRGVGDETVMALARDDDRVVVTMNRKHFMRLHRVDSEHRGIVVCTVDLDFVGLADRIDAALLEHSTMTGKLVRVYRPVS